MPGDSRGDEIRSFSYVDSATNFVFFNLELSDLGHLQSRLNRALEIRDDDRDRFSQEMLSIAYEILMTQFRATFFHEWHHVLQTIFYPYRYLQSWRELRIALQVLSAMRNSPETLKIGHFDIPPVWRDTILSASMVMGLEIEDGQLRPVLDRDPPPIRPGDFTITDLTEEATTIFEFKVRIGGEGDGEAYHQWIREQKLAGRSPYCNLFRFLSKLIGKNGAYIALPALVQAALSTTWPLVTFVGLVNWVLAGKDLYTPEEIGIDALYRILRHKLDNPFWATPGNPPALDGPAGNDEYCFLDFDIYKQLVSASPEHTVYYHASRYIELVEETPELETVLFHPYRTDVQELITEEFFAPLTYLRIHHGPVKARDSILYISPALNERPTPFDPEITYDVFFLEVMKRKDIAYSLFSDLNDYLEHACHHVDCQYYGLNLCRRWSAIPKEIAQCPFLNWFEIVTYRTIDIEKRELPRVR